MCMVSGVVSGRGGGGGCQKKGKGTKARRLARTAAGDVKIRRYDPPIFPLFDDIVSHLIVGFACISFNEMRSPTPSSLDHCR